LKDYQLGRRPQGQEGNLFVLGEDKDIAGERVQYLVGLLEVAALYQLERLKSLIADALMPPSSMITHGNAFDIRRYARAASQNDLIAYCTAYIRENHELLEDCVRDEIQRYKEERAEIRRLMGEHVPEFEDSADDSEDEDGDGDDSEYEDCADGEDLTDEDDHAEVEDEDDWEETEDEDDGEDTEDEDESRGEGASDDVKEGKQPDPDLLKRLEELDCELLNYEDHLQELLGMAA